MSTILAYLLLLYATSPLGMLILFGREVMKKGVLLFIVCYAIVCSTSEITSARELEDRGGKYGSTRKEGKLRCALTVPSVETYYRKSQAIYITKKGYVASTEEALLDEAIHLASSGDRSSYLKFISANKTVFFLNGNLLAKIKKTSLPGKIQIRLIHFNILLWTTKEAIK